MGVIPLLVQVLKVLTVWLDIKARRENFDLDTTINNEAISVKAQVLAARALGTPAGDALADSLLNNWATRAAAAGASLIQPAGAVPPVGSANPGK